MLAGIGVLLLAAPGNEQGVEVECNDVQVAIPVEVSDLPGTGFVQVKVETLLHGGSVRGSPIQVTGSGQPRIVPSRVGHQQLCMVVVVQIDHGHPHGHDTGITADEGG